MRRSSAIVVASLLALATACAPAQAAKRPSPAALARAIVKGTPKQAISASITALARGGLTVRQGAKVYARAARPAVPGSVTRWDAVNLALDARGASADRGLSVARLGSAWARVGAMRRLGRRPDRVARHVLATWVREARKRPRAAGSFAPLFLAELARLRRGRVSLAKGTYAPARVELSELEVMLVHAGFVRGMGRYLKGVRHRTRAAAAPASCSDVIKEHLESAFPGNGTLTAFAYQQLFGETISKAAAELVSSQRIKSSPAAAKILKARAEAISGVLGKLNMLMRIQKAAALSAAVRMYVDVPQTPIEKPEDRQNVTVKKYGAFVANVGLSPEAEAAYERELQTGGSGIRALRRAIQDCASTLGLPVPTYKDDFAEDLDTFRIKWSLAASPNTARYERAKTRWLAPGTHVAPLTRVDDRLAAHVMYVEIPAQAPWDHAHPENYRVVRHTATATAKLDTSQPPGLGTLLSAVTGGLPDALLEAAVGFYQSVAGPPDSGDLVVTEHVPDCGAGAARAAAGGSCGADVVVHVASTWQCAGQPAPVKVDDFTLAATGRAGFLSGSWWTYDGNGCTAGSATRVTDEKATVSTSKSGKTLTVSWAPSKTMRWARSVDVPATVGRHTATYTEGDENATYKDTFTVDVNRVP